MSAGILERDQGKVYAESTWHNLPQYECLDRPVTVPEAYQILDYDIEKRQLMRPDNNGNLIPVKAWAIVRPDYDETLVESVGERFVALNNKHMMKIIDEFILAAYPDLMIESVGTLWNGAIAFVNLKLQDYFIQGDPSKHLTNLMYSNPLGKGSYSACAHTIRVLCANTHRMAEAQGAANNTLAKFRHTLTAGDRIKNHLIDLAEVHLGVSSFIKTMEAMAKDEIDTEYVDKFLNKFFPVEGKEGRGETIAKNNRVKYMEIFESKQDMELATAYSKYGVFNAFTNLIDHHTISRNSDEASVAWDSINGIRANKKNDAMEWLITN